MVNSWQILPGGMAMELTDSLKSLFIETATSLKGSARRLCMARTVKELGAGEPRRAERELGWGRLTIRKGLHELESGFTCLDAFSARGRKRVEASLPNLLPDIRAIIDSQSQADPQFRTNRLYTRLSAVEVRRQLITPKGDTDDALPTVQTITTKLNALGYYPKKVTNSQPQQNPRNRCQLRPSDADQSGCRCRERRLTPLHGCQSHHQSWLLRAWGQKSYPGHGGRSRFCPRRHPEALVPFDEEQQV